MSKKAAIFFDRDDTIIFDTGYINDPRQVRLIPGASDALKALKEKGFLLMLVSNQSGIGRGLITEDQAEQVHNKTVSFLELNEVYIDASYYCPHMPEDLCKCRKPSPEMILRAVREFDIDPSYSFMIGDKQSDIDAGRNAGCRTILIKTGDRSDLPDGSADYLARDWQDALKYISGKGPLKELDDISGEI